MMQSEPPYSYVFEPLTYWAEMTPDHPAVVSTELTWTYAQVESRTNQLARALQEVGIQRSDRVAFILPRGPKTVLLLIAILKAGAAYVPLDSESPPTRIAECLEDAEPQLVVVSDAKAVIGFSLKAKVVSLDALLAEADRQEIVSFNSTSIGVLPSDLAYIIFTSGTTGRPKGVPIAHESLSNYVSGNQEVCMRVERTDRVLQAFSPASDGHHEEVWPTLMAGATLVVASSREVHSGTDLTVFLNEHAVTIVSCAPTLMSLVESDVPSIRRILFGAENLPATLVSRWWRHDREIINTYGPTEATVGTTYGVCTPNDPITIGRPLPNYYCYVLDESQGQVSDGQEGELAIAGISVSAGYFRRDELNVGRFLSNPYANPGERNDVMYRTGDRVRRDPSGNLVWLGRIDAQVKIRGHRVELTEIESNVLTYAAVKTAVVVARKSGESDLNLVALICVREGVEFMMSEFVDQMRLVLPAHMIPQQVELIEQIPVLPSGKVDRRACGLLRGHPVRLEREILPPSTPTEAMVVEVWAGLFQTEEISCADDFFTDLGGHSLLASRFVSSLRSDHGFSKVSVIDIYENPTVRSFSALLDAQTQHAHERPTFKVVSRKRYRRAMFAQGICILVLYSIQALLWLGPIAGAIYFSDRGLNDAAAVAVAVLLHSVTVPAVFLFAIVVKWTIGGRFEEGSYPMWGATFIRWWFVSQVMKIAPVVFLTGTPLAGVYLRLMGAKVGKNVTFESLDVDCPDMVEIGDDCTFENSSWIRPAEVSHGELHIHRVRVGNGCLVGVRSGIAGGVEMHEGASLRDLSCVSTGSVVPRHEEWAGSPAKLMTVRELPIYDPGLQPSNQVRLKFAIAQALLVGLLTMLDSVPFLVVGFTLYSRSEGLAAYLWEPVYAIALVAFACVQALFFKWLVIGKLRPGTFDFPGWYWVRKWFSDKHLELMTGTIVPVYDSLFARPWCRALGMKCGPRCEIALPRRMPYDLVEMGEESFLASEVSIGMPIRRNGKLFLERTVVESRVFLGNDSVLPQGTTVSRESLLGVLSVWPRSADSSVPGQAWLGSPSFEMPHRHVNVDFDIQQTYRPTKALYVERLIHEILRIILPSLLSLMVMAAQIEGFVWVWNETSFRVAVVCSPFIYLLGAVLAAFMCWFSKLLLVFKYRPTISPLWSRFVWKAETYSAVLHDFGVPVFINPLVGTPYINGLMRFLGAKVGRRAFINTTDWTETDLIHIGEDAALNENAPLQAHLFEDRVMKIGTIRIGDRCSVGNFSVILCDSRLKDDSHVGHLSLVMKGETIPSETFWSGCPARIAADPVQEFEKRAK